MRRFPIKTVAGPAGTPTSVAFRAAVKGVKSMGMRCLFIGLAAAVVSVGQSNPVEPRVISRTMLEGRVTTLHLAPRFTTTIQMPEPVNSVVVGDPAEFQVEHSEREPTLVFVKPRTVKAARTNLLISTVRGHRSSLLLVSAGGEVPECGPPVHFVLHFRSAGSFLIEPSDYPRVLIPETATVGPKLMTPDPPIAGTAGPQRDLDELLSLQKRAELPVLHGDRIRAGVGQVIDQGRQVVVLFAVVNPAPTSIELMPPQVQLGGRTRAGTIIRRSRWSTAEQLPVTDFRLSRRLLGPGERADGVVVFDRPPFKQSNETLLLQVAESGAVDRPALVPIGFGISTHRKGNANGNR
jgi:hypothetical protein